MSSQAVGIVSALGSALCWAVGLVILKKIKADVSAFGMTLVTGVLGSVLLGVYLACTGLEPIAMWPFLLLGISGILGISLGDTFFFESLDGLSAHLVVLFGILGQALTVVLAVVFLGELVTPVQGLGIAMVVGGVFGAMVRRDRDAEQRRSTLRGVVFGVLSAVTMAVSIVIAKVGLEAVSAAQATFTRMLWGAAGIALFGLVRGQVGSWISPFRDRSLLGKLLLAVLVGTFGGFLLYHMALKNADVSVVNPLAATEPLFTIPLAALLLAEKITRWAVVGSVVAVAGAVLLCVG